MQLKRLFKEEKNEAQIGLCVILHVHTPYNNRTKIWRIRISAGKINYCLSELHRDRLTHEER